MLQLFGRHQGPTFVQSLAGSRATGGRQSQFLRPSAGLLDMAAPDFTSQRPAVLPIFAMVACAAAAMRAQVMRRAKGKPQTTSGIRVRKPKNNALRNCSIATFEELTCKQRYEPLTYMYRRKFARPTGSPIQMATRTIRESGHKYRGAQLPKGNRHARMYRIIDFAREKRDVFGSIQTIEYDPYRNARICLVKFEDGEFRYVLHAMGYFIGQQVISSTDAPVFVGNAMPIDKVPIGTMVHNIEMRAGQGAGIARAAGTAATVLSHGPKYTTVKMPSSEVRLIPAASWCTIGKVGRPEASLIKLGKAGKSRHLGFTPHVRGSAKNACDHPHGGGEGRSPIGHRHPKTPFGKCAKGMTTRRPQWSDRQILIKRKKKSGRS
eukprot:TRINITY_DN520_c0_g1_i1.p1 TRINITY_DN520_c0_g1~~TRINITY_DN520_c0_g1_i1.p1  ORF type:complete len:414 (+),score=64.95 TRINITY_DN520_c0_g1_i1:111-1244(+)